MINQQREIILDMPDGRPSGTAISTNMIDGIGSVEKWTFLCGGFLPALELRANGTILHGGYTIQELQEFADKAEAKVDKTEAFEDEI